jgi:aryl-alcohol dehydrogenase-like predicted oxidoreductase
VLALKLWLWDYPTVSLADQARASLKRLSADYVEMIMVSRPTPDVDAARFCEEIGALVSTGTARAWCATNWEPAQIALAQRALPGPLWPRMVQLQYNVARRDVTESADFCALFDSSALRLCAAFVLEGGILAGHLDRDRVDPSGFAQGERPLERNIARDAGGIRDRVRAIQPQLATIAASLDASAAQLAIAFTLANPATATTLMGVTRLSDLQENVDALRLLPSAAEWLPRLAPLRVHGTLHPRLFDPVRHE